MVAFGAVVVFVVMMLLEVFRVAVMLFRILDDVLKPKRVLFDLWRVFLSIPVDLLADVARRILVLAVDEFQVIGCEFLRKIELGRFELNEGRLCGERSAFGPRHFEVGRWAARNGFYGKTRKQQDVERWKFMVMRFAVGTQKTDKLITLQVMASPEFSFWDGNPPRTLHVSLPPECKMFPHLITIPEA